MKNKKTTLVCLAAVMAMMSTGVSCSSKNSSETAPTTDGYKGFDDIDINEIRDIPKEPSDKMNITWLSYYDLNPSGSQDRSVALTLFEDVFGGKINYVQTTPQDKFDKLAAMISSGDEVDMFPYEWDALPSGVLNEQYEPLDPYFEDLEMDTPLWSDMKDVIEMFKYKDQHYVIPYTISDPLILTYSRTMMQEEGLDDPYELYLKGEWNWDVFMEMMEKFKGGAASRYGICGWFGQAAIQSTGHTVISYENGKFVNNINDAEIEKAENLLQDIAQKGLFRKGEWFGNFPTDKTTLFYAMGDWALGASNAENPELDLMVVPFPKAPDADEYYISCSYGARMLVKNSKKGEAVATYIRCERLAETEEKYREAAKQKALIEDKTASGLLRSFITEEQYDAVASFKDTSNVTPVFDFGYGMGDVMHGTGMYTYETRGVMDNLETALLEGNETVDSWAALRDAWTGVVSAEVSRFNN